MSNFGTINQVTQGLAGTAPIVWCASTADSLATITTAGYLNDIAVTLKNNDLFLINYSDTSTFPLGESSVFGQFLVSISGANTSLVTAPALGIPALSTFDVTVGQAALATAGHVALVTSSGSRQYRVRMLQLNSGGTNFSGGGGDRLGQVSDGTTVYSVVPAATMQALVNAQWGVTALPNPASAAIFTPTAAGANLFFAYSGGATDYTAGSLRISGLVERIV